MILQFQDILCFNRVVFDNPPIQYFQLLQKMKFLVADLEKKNTSKPKQQANKKNDPSSVFYNINNPSNRVQCDVCKRDISKYTKILSDESDYCIDCFSNLEKFPSTYHVINKMDYPVYQADWTAEEELLLFEGLEKHGFGNWGQIADFIGNGKTREEVESHYNSIYIDSKQNLENRQVLTRRDNKTLKLIKKINSTNNVRRASKQTKKISYENKYQHQRGSLTVNNNQSSSLKTNANAAEIVGYMPKRGDFQVEYDNDAELLLAQMQFNDDDTEDEKKMKFKLIDIYNQKLTERIRRKQFVISRNLLDLKQQTRLDKNRTKQERQIHNMMKVFARFNKPEDHQKLVNGILRERQIRQRIQELKEFRKKGFRTLAEVQQELEKKRTKQQRAKSKKVDEANNYYVQGYDAKNTRRSRKEAPVERNEKRTTVLNLDQEQLCRRLNIPPKQFMLIKQTILREAVRTGLVERNQLLKIFKVDRNIVEGVFDFLVTKEQIIGK